MFENKVMLVTGAASGLGEATVRAASAQGARVLALDIQDTAAYALCSETGAQYLHCDVSKAQDWHAVRDQITAADGAGPPDYLYLNAGIQIAPPSAPMAEYTFDAMTEERYRRLMGVNVDGVVFGLHTLLPIMQPGSSIVVTCSLAGVTPYAIDPLYSMSKHAVAGLVRSMGPVLAERDIKINAICPGGVDTALIPTDQRQQIEAITAQGQGLMTPAQLAQDVLALFDAPETGKTWAKVAETKAPFIIRAPGDKKRSAKVTPS